MSLASQFNSTIHVLLTNTLHTSSRSSRSNYPVWTEPTHTSISASCLQTILPRPKWPKRRSLRKWIRRRGGRLLVI